MRPLAHGCVRAAITDADARPPRRTCTTARSSAPTHARAHTLRHAQAAGCVLALEARAPTTPRTTGPARPARSARGFAGSAGDGGAADAAGAAADGVPRCARRRRGRPPPRVAPPPLDWPCAQRPHVWAAPRDRVGRLPAVTRIKDQDARWATRINPTSWVTRKLGRPGGGGESLGLAGERLLQPLSQRRCTGGLAPTPAGEKKV